MGKKTSPAKKVMEGGGREGGEEEIARDPGLTQHHSSTAKDDEGHYHHNVYMGLPISSHTRRSKHHRHRHHHRHAKPGDAEENRPDGHHHHHHHKHHHHNAAVEMEAIEEDNEHGFYLTPPSERVQFILGENYVEGEMHESHPLFSEMETLCEMENGELEWKETARWVKFEEDVEEGGERWSKPHVSTLSLHSLFELRSLILKGTIILDMDAFNLVQISDLILDNMINACQLPAEKRDMIEDALLRKHKHLYEKTKNKENGNMSRLPLIRSLAEIGRNHSSAKGGLTGSLSTGGFFSKAFSFSGGNNASVDLDTSPSQGSIPNTQSGNNLDSSTQDLLIKGNTHFMKKIPPGSEAANILVGEVSFLDKPIMAFVRLSQGATLGNMTEVPVPTRFIFLMLGPKGALSRYHEIGRAMATLLGDEVFHDVAYKASNRNHLLAGIDEFLDAVTVLPPGEWDPSIRIEPPDSIPSQSGRKNVAAKKAAADPAIDDEEYEQKHREDAGLVRTGRLFGGFVNDLKRKAPFYLSDFKDGLSMQSVASFCFLYFACLTPIITFGGLLGEATGNNIAAMESLVAGLICGVAYGFFSAQPLTILGSTGPVLVFETILYDFCDSIEWNYLSFRMWVGIWAAIILLILVAVDASAFVCYITRFTEENFATLIALIFIYKAIEKVLKIGSKYPMMTNVDDVHECICQPPFDYNETINDFDYTSAGYNKTVCESVNGTMFGDGCTKYYSDIYMLSLILFCGTFLISICLKNFKSAPFFPAKVRNFISDFAVIIAIVLMTLLDFSYGIHTPKLMVPSEFKPTSPDRGWIVDPFAQNPWWSAILAVVPAILCCILLFMDQQITAVIINRKEHKLKKGGGYHLDLFVLSLLVVVNSVMGLPWFVAATVLSINHVNSLRIESETSAPGEKPQFLGIRENRVTHILIFLFIGMSVFMTPILRIIPMAVLFGVFLYMGIAALNGIQFFDRILIMFMPVKYQPDYAFLRQVPLKRVHIFTCIQILCLASLWIIKSFKQTSILFPLMLVVMLGIRKVLDFFFTRRELMILDDILPEFKRKEKIYDEEEGDVKEGGEGGEDLMMTIPLANGNVMKVPLNPINISEEMNKSGVWKDINEEGENTKTNKTSLKKRGSKKDAKHEDEKKRLSLMVEEDEGIDENGITIKID